MEPPPVSFLAILKNCAGIASILKTSLKCGLIKTDCRCMAKVYLLLKSAPFSKQAIMHRPILALRPSTARRRRRIDARTLIGAWIIAVDKSDFPGIDIPGLNARPGVFEKFQTVPTGEIRVFDQGQRRIGLPPDPDVGIRRIPGGGYARPYEDATDTQWNQPSINRPSHDWRTTPAFFLSSSPIIKRGHTTVASLKTSANCPPSLGVTNFPQESPSWYVHPLSPPQ